MLFAKKNHRQRAFVAMGLGLFLLVGTAWGQSSNPVRNFWNRMIPSKDQDAPQTQATAYPPAPIATDGFNPVGTPTKPTEPTLPVPESTAPPATPVPPATSMPPATPPVAKPSASQTLPNPYPVEKQPFQLPFETLLASRPIQQIQEVRLYASKDKGGTWSLYQTFPKEKLGGAEPRLFNVRTARDGEYWFVVSLLDTQNVEYPRPDMGPTWRIIVNTSGKPLDSTAVGAGTMGTDGTQRPVWTPNPKDNLMSNGGNVPQSNNPNSVAFSLQEANQETPKESTLPVFKMATPAPVETEKSASTPPAAPDTAPDTALPNNASDSATPEASADPATPVPAATETSEMDMLLQLSAPSNATPEQSTVRYTNKPQIMVDYDITAVGPSGVGKVELWGTLDGGTTWTFLAEDKDCTSPMQVDLKVDGEYGLFITIQNGAGIGGEPPKPGTIPQKQVILDRELPKLQFRAVRLMADFGELDIQWDAYDLHFGANPILLSWSANMEGPWRALTTPLENNGQYSWRIPDNLPGKIFIRMDACDMAKNTTTLATGPIVTDLARPTGTIRDAKPVGN